MFKDKTYHIALLYGKEDIRVEELNLPDLSESEVLVRMRAATICPTDIRKYKGLVDFPSNPIPLGHEGSGEVAKVGKNVSKVKVGDKVAITPDITCGRCYYCHLGIPVLCKALISIGGVTPHKSSRIFKERGIGGTFAEYLKVPQNCVYRMPSDIPFERISLAEPMASTLHSCLRGMRTGDTVCIVGAGPMGLLHILIARILGASKIIVSEPIRYRREIAQKMGANVTINPMSENLEQVIKYDTNGRGVDDTFITVGGKAQVSLVEESLKYTAERGKIVSFASAQPPANVSLPINDIHYKEIDIRGALGYDRSDWYIVLNWIKNGILEPENIVKPHIPLSEIEWGLKEYGGKNTLKVGLELGKN